MGNKVDHLFCSIFGHDWGRDEFIHHCFHATEVICSHWTRKCLRCGKEDPGYYPGPVNDMCRQWAKKGACRAVVLGMDKKELLAKRRPGIVSRHYGKLRILEVLLAIMFLWLVVHGLHLLWCTAR
jgi:hypothetical protein